MESQNHSQMSFTIIISTTAAQRAAHKTSEPVDHVTAVDKRKASFFLHANEGGKKKKEEIKFTDFSKHLTAASALIKTLKSHMDLLLHLVLHMKAAEQRVPRGRGLW